MSTNNFIPRLIGILLLVSLVLGIVGIVWPLTIIGTGKTSDILVNISNNATQFRISILIELVANLIVVLNAVLFFKVLYKFGLTIARVAAVLMVIGTIVIVLSKISYFSLLYLSEQWPSVQDSSILNFELLVDMMINARDLSFALALQFFGVSGALFYYLFFNSNYIPKLLAIWGIAASFLAMCGKLLLMLDLGNYEMFYIPNLLFGIVIGLWFIIKGFNRTYRLTLD